MVYRAFVVSGLILLAGCPDKNNPERQIRMAVVKMSEYADKMCACKDKACADRVNEELTRWSTEMARDAGQVRDHKPDEEAMKKMVDAGTRYGECMTKVMGEPYATPPREDIPPASTTHDADVLIREARTWARGKHPQHFVTDARINYVDSNGELDPEYGEVVIAFGRSFRSADVPKRKIGAPVVVQKEPDDCFQLSWKRGAGWSRTTFGCNETDEVNMRCATRQIWMAAIQRTAPPQGLATLSWRPTANGGSWEFRIQDEPRKINIVESFEDDCPLAVEK